MKNFAFIVSPINVKQLQKLWPAMKLFPDFIIKSFSNSLPPSKVFRIKDIRSKQGAHVDGFLIVCPLLPEQMSSLGEDLVLDRVISAGHTAEKLGARIVGLDCFAASIADKGYNTLVKSLKIPVTSGHALTAWSVFEGVYRIAKAKKIELKESSLAIIGSVSTALSLSARKLADYVERVILVDKEGEKVEMLREAILASTNIEVVIENNTREAVKNAQIVIKESCREESAADFKPQDLKSNAVFCHIPSFYNGFNKSILRSDVTFAELGLIKLPFHPAPGSLYGFF